MTFLESLARAGIPFRRTPGSDEVAIICPFCPGERGETDTAFAFHVNIRNGKGHCWHAGCDYKTRRAFVAILGQLGKAIEAPEETEEEYEEVTLPEDFLPLSKAVDDLDRMALGYLLKRGITERQIRRRKIGVSYVGRYAYRVVVPVYVERDLKGLVARDFTGRQKPKYLNSRGEKFLFGFDPTKREVVLCEGVFKALRVERSGRSAAALLGHDLTPAQLEQIKDSKCRRVVLFPDPDGVGRKGVAKIAEKLLDKWSGAVSVVWPVTKPADDMRLSELREVTIHPYNWTMHQQLVSTR